MVDKVILLLVITTVVAYAASAIHWVYCLFKRRFGKVAALVFIAFALYFAVALYPEYTSFFRRGE